MMYKGILLAFCVFTNLAATASSIPFSGDWQGDEGFRYKSGQCVNDNNERGYNYSYLGQCSDLSNLILGGFDLRQVDFSGSQFAGTDFRFSQLDEAILVGTDLKDAKLTGTSMNQANLSQANAQGANFEGVVADGLIVDGVNFENATFNGSQFLEIDFSKSKLGTIQAKGVSFEGSKFTGLNLENSNFLKAKLREGDFSKAQLSRSNFEAAQMERANFESAKGSEINFRNSQLRSAKLDQTDFKGAIFNAAVLDQVSAVGADWSGSDLSKAVLSNSDLRMLDLTDSSLRAANLMGAKLDGIQLKGAIFDDLTKLELTMEERQSAGMIYLPVYSVEMPRFQNTFQSSNDTRGFWFKAPKDMYIVGLQVPDERSQGKQNVHVYVSNQVYPDFAAVLNIKPVYKAIGVDASMRIETNIAIMKDQYVGILGATGDTTMNNSYAPTFNFETKILGEKVRLTRLLTERNIVGQNGELPLSSEPSGQMARIHFWVSPKSIKP